MGWIIGPRGDRIWSSGPQGSAAASASSSVSTVTGGGSVEVRGAEEAARMFDFIRTKDPQMDKALRALIRKVLKVARGKLSKDIANELENDPRKAARAVKYAVYKQLLGGNLSVLARRKASNTFVSKWRERKLDKNPHQRGGNRIKRVDDDRNRLDKYFGADRSFVLRFLICGTENRRSRYGNRGSISPRGIFEHSAPSEMEAAVEELANNAVEYINSIANG